jgi:hypothetical protein
MEGTSMSVFLQEADLVILTGRPQKSKQIAALRKMHIPFFVNAVGKPVVAVAAVEGKKPGKDATPVKKWEPKD